MSDIDGVLDDRDALWGQCGAYDEQVERMARVIVRYRWQIKMLSVNGESHIADIERDLTDEDRALIGEE